jgi:Arc/MetJ family transcription regulator
MARIKRTSLNLDFELVEKARAELGTNGTTDTVHRALQEVVRRAALKRLTEVRFDHLPPNWLEELRRSEHDPDE